MSRAFRIFLICTILMPLLIGASTAQAGILEFFFPSIRKKGPDPMETLQAPFAMDPNAKPPETAPDPRKVFLPENKLPLDQPHRDSGEIATWLTTVTSEVLNFNTPDYRAALKEDEKYFTARGKEQYLEFLTANNIMKVLESGKFQVRSFVQDTPLLLNEGAVNGSYRWLYEVPMMLTYLEKDVKNYKNVEPVNQQIVLTVQIGRVPSDDNSMAVLIERWEGRAQRLSKK